MVAAAAAAVVGLVVAPPPTAALERKGGWMDAEDGPGREEWGLDGRMGRWYPG